MNSAPRFFRFQHESDRDSDRNRVLFKNVHPPPTPLQLPAEVVRQPRHHIVVARARPQRHNMHTNHPLVIACAKWGPVLRAPLEYRGFSMCFNKIEITVRRNPNSFVNGN